jgi:hypothetical protein
VIVVPPHDGDLHHPLGGVGSRHPTFHTPDHGRFEPIEVSQRGGYRFLVDRFTGLDPIHEALNLRANGFSRWFCQPDRRIGYDGRPACLLHHVSFFLLVTAR